VEALQKTIRQLYIMVQAAEGTLAPMGSLPEEPAGEAMAVLEVYCEFHAAGGGEVTLMQMISPWTTSSGQIRLI
jgi:hypothetical protein